MMIIGLSGGIASGKNFICDIFLRYNAKIFDADNIVNDLIANDKNIISQIAETFPSCYRKGFINKKILADIVFGSEYDYSFNINKLETIIHPQVRIKYQDFVNDCQKNKVKIIILNIPLLVEKNFYKYNKLIVIDCHKNIRKKRFLERSKVRNSKDFNADQMLKRFDLICSKQLTDKERIKKADFVIDNNKSMFVAIKQAKKIMLNLLT